MKSFKEQEKQLSQYHKQIREQLSTIKKFEKYQKVDKSNLEGQ